MDPVAAYLQYLREMARKIAYRGTFLNVLSGKTRRSPDRYFDEDARITPVEFQRYLAGVEQDVRTNEERTLFLGTGLLVGSVARSGRRVQIAAPLITTPAEVSAPEENLTDIQFELDWTGSSVNYDLVSAILERNGPVDPEDAIGAPDLLPPSATAAITTFERELEKKCRAPNPGQRLRDPSFIENALSEIRANVPAFRDVITSSPTPYRKDQLATLIASDGLIWFNHRFLFMGSMPDSLSAYEALNEMCKIRAEQA